MSKILGLFGAGIAYLCIGTVLALLIGGLSLWTSGALDKDKVYGMLAVAYGQSPGPTSGTSGSGASAEQVSYE